MLRLTKRRQIIGIARPSMPGLEHQAGEAGVLHDVAPARISDVVGGAERQGRRVLVVTIPMPVALAHELFVPGTAVEAGHASGPARVGLGQAELTRPALDARAVPVLGCEKSSRREKHTNNERTRTRVILYAPIRAYTSVCMCMGRCTMSATFLSALRLIFSPFPATCFHSADRDARECAIPRARLLCAGISLGSLSRARRVNPNETTAG